MAEPTTQRPFLPKKWRFRSVLQVRKIRRLFRLLRPYARPHKMLLVTGVGLSFTVIALHLAQPWPLKWVVDALVGSPSHHQLFPWLQEHPEYAFGALAGLYILISLLAALAEYGQLLTLAGLGNRILFGFRTALFSHVLRQPMAFHEGRETGELLTRIIYDTARMRQGVNSILTRIFLAIFTFLATFGILLWLDVTLALVVGATGTLALLVMAYSSRRIFRAARLQRKREGKLAATVAENLLGIREVQTFRPGVGADDRFTRHNAKSMKQEQKVRRLGAKVLVRVEIQLALCVTIILWLGARAVQAGRLTPGDLVLFVAYVVALHRPFSQFARQTVRSGKTFASAHRLDKIMAKEPAIRDMPGAVRASPFAGKIVFENVSVKRTGKHQASRKWILDDISFRVEPGERVGVVGHNGAGKSTLLRLMLRLMDPKRGRVEIDGRDAREYTVESLRRQVSVVFQDSVFFGLSVRGNIALGRNDATPEEIEEVAQRTLTADFVERLPKGFDTTIRQRGKLFSVGERQRIAIARALLRDGRLWLLDEPTTGLDTEALEDLIKLLLEVTRHRTVFWVTHDHRILPALDRVLVLKEGGIPFLGTPSEYGRWIAQDLPQPAPVREKILREEI